MYLRMSICLCAMALTLGACSPAAPAKGEKGDKGEQGAKGDKGDNGEKGDKGDPGAPGNALRIIGPADKAQCNKDEILISAYCVGGTSPTPQQISETGAKCAGTAKVVAVCAKR